MPGRKAPEHRRCRPRQPTGTRPRRPSPLPDGRRLRNRTPSLSLPALRRPTSHSECEPPRPFQTNALLVAPCRRSSLRVARPAAFPSRLLERRTRTGDKKENGDPPRPEGRQIAVVSRGSRRRLRRIDGSVPGREYVAGLSGNPLVLCTNDQASAFSTKLRNVVMSRGSTRRSISFPSL